MHSSKLKYSFLVAGLLFGLSPVSLMAADSTTGTTTTTETKQMDHKEHKEEYKAH